MAFILPTDYDTVINSDELNVLTEGNNVTLLQAESMAINKIKHQLSSKFDTDAIFNAQGDARDLTIVEYTIYYTLYMLYTKIAKVKVPSDRYVQYKEAKDFFKAASEGTIQTNLPSKIATEIDDFIDFKFESDNPYETTY